MSAFVPVTLAFKDLSYEVKSSTGLEMLCLLNNVSGVFLAGRICALMGESGAGKTITNDAVDVDCAATGQCLHTYSNKIDPLRS